ncbi:hypothetical protein K1719_003733 [Acacia pycnantha]|nr:hypothetical protein K1719_003733 [Acacia pycnantha]
MSIIVMDQEYPMGIIGLGIAKKFVSMDSLEKSHRFSPMMLLQSNLSEVAVYPSPCFQADAWKNELKHLQVAADMLH